MTTMNDELLFEVSDLKQWDYCPRVVYYRFCTPDIRPTTKAMEHGRERHADEAEREARRSLRNYGLQQGERVSDVYMRSPTLGLRGRLDLAIAVPDRTSTGAEAVVIEYKDSEEINRPHFKLQLAAYGLLLEEAWGLPVKRGFLYSIPLRKATPVPLTASLRRKVADTVAAMRVTVVGERMPEAPSARRPCVSCEFRRFCNDVV